MHPIAIVSGRKNVLFLRKQFSVCVSRSHWRGLRLWSYCNESTYSYFVLIKWVLINLLGKITAFCLKDPIRPCPCSLCRLSIWIHIQSIFHWPIPKISHSEISFVVSVFISFDSVPQRSPPRRLTGLRNKDYPSVRLSVLLCRVFET